MKNRNVGAGILGDLGFVAILCLELAVLLYDLPRHHQLLLHLSVWIALIIFPLTLLAVVVRSPWGTRRWPRRIVMRPFRILKSKSDLDGTALASLLDRSMGWGLSEKFYKGDATAAGATPVLSLGWASVPLDWAWNTFLRLSTGRSDVFVDGLLVERESEASLYAWTSNSKKTFEEFVELPLTPELRNTFDRLALDILEELEPVRVAYAYQALGRYDDAIRLLLSANNLSVDDRQTLAFLHLQNGHLTLGERLFDMVKDGLPGSVSRFLNARIETSRTAFSKAQSLLIGLGGSSPDDLSILGLRAKVLLAEGLAYRHCLEEAIDAYKYAFNQFDAMSQCLLGTGWNDSPHNFESYRKAARSVPESERSDVIRVLQIAVEILDKLAGVNSLLVSLDPADSITMRTIVEKQRYSACSLQDIGLGLIQDSWFTTDDELLSQLRLDADLFSKLAHSRLAIGDADGLAEAANRALEYYEEAVSACESVLQKGKPNRTAEAAIVWCHFGRSRMFTLIAQCQDSEKHIETAAATVVNPDEDRAGFVAFFSILADLPTEEDDRTAAIFESALLRGAGEGRKLRLWRLAEEVATLLIKTRGSRVLELLALLNCSPENVFADFSNTITYPPLLEVQNTTDLDGNETKELVRGLYRQFVAYSEVKEDAEVSRMFAAAKAERMAKQAKDGFSQLAGSSHELAESAYGRACLAAVAGDSQSAIALLQEADSLSGDATWAYRQRAFWDVYFDDIRSLPEFEAAVFPIMLPNNPAGSQSDDRHRPQETS